MICRKRREKNGKFEKKINSIFAACRVKWFDKNGDFFSSAVPRCENTEEKPRNNSNKRPKRVVCEILLFHRRAAHFPLKQFINFNGCQNGLTITIMIMFIVHM